MVALLVLVMVSFWVISPASGAFASTMGNNGKLKVVKKGPLTFFIPPKGFNPITASNSTLRKYHLPPRPSNPADLKAWKQLMKDVKFKAPQKVKISNRVSPPPSHVSRISSNATSGRQSYYYSNWNGFGVRDSGFTGAKASWTVPYASDPQGHKPAYSCSWVGMGGYSNADDILVQAGTESDIKSDGNGRYYWWVELFNTATGGGHQIQLGSGIPNPGDRVYIGVYYYPLQGAFFTIEDSTLGVAYTGQYTYMDPISGVAPKSAEWITERTGRYDSSGDIYYPYLAGFNTIYWDGMAVSKSGYYSTPIWHHPDYYALADQIAMYDGSGTKLVSKTTLGTGNSGYGYFHQNFLNQGEIDYP